MISPRIIGILWVVAGFGLLLLASSREPRHTPLLIVGAVFVALGAALIRRSSRRAGKKP